jgi:hypothetical protein
MKKFTVVLILALCVGLGVVFVFDSRGISVAVFESIQLCLNTVIPSLFAFLALSTFLMSSGIIKGEVAIFILSMLGGYPVGAKLIADSSLTKERKQHMLMYCFCGSPVFLIALIPHNNLGLYIWLSNVSACVIFAILSNASSLTYSKAKSHKSEIKINSRIFIASVTSAGTTLYKVCIMIVAFGVITRLLELMGLTSSILYSLVEITNVMTVQENPAIIATLTSIGGVCIIFQVYAICGGKLSLRRFLYARIPIAALSSGICFLLTKGLATEAIAEEHRIEATSGGSMVASICLLIMTLILLHKDTSSSC